MKQVGMFIVGVLLAITVTAAYARLVQETNKMLNERRGKDEVRKAQPTETGVGQSE